MHVHLLHEDKHEKFLAQQRIDPITGDTLLAGDKVVLCAECKSAFHIDSWNYLGAMHCNQTRTLPAIPQTTSLGKIKKRSDSFYTSSRTSFTIQEAAQVNIVQRIAAFAIDVVLILIIKSFIWIPDLTNLLWFYMLARDTTVKGVYLSLGKNILGFKVEERHTHAPLKLWQSVLRNAPFALPRVVPLMVSWFSFDYNLYKSLSVVSNLATAIFSLIMLIDIILLFGNNRRIVDRLLNLKSVRNRNREV